MKRCPCCRSWTTLCWTTFCCIMCPLMQTLVTCEHPCGGVRCGGMLQALCFRFVFDFVQAAFWHNTHRLSEHIQVGMLKAPFPGSGDGPCTCTTVKQLLLEPSPGLCVLAISWSGVNKLRRCHTRAFSAVPLAHGHASDVWLVCRSNPMAPPRRVQRTLLHVAVCAARVSTCGKTQENDAQCVA